MVPADAVRPRRRGRPLARPLACSAIAVIGLGGCATGARARLAAEASTTGDAAVDAVLGRIESLGDAVYTATYDAHVSFGDVDVDVTVSQSAPDRRSVTIGDVRYLVDHGRPETCHLDTTSCEPGLDPAAVSDVQMTNDFFGTNLAARLRSDAAAAVGPPVASTEEIEGQTATCVGIPLTPPASAPDALPVSTYCVLDDGVLARLDAADLRVILTDYSDEADEDQFTT